MPRALLSPLEATNDGSRRLRELLLTRSLGKIAQRLACTRKAVSNWAHELRNPTPEWREEMQKVLTIPAEAWGKPNALTTPVISVRSS